jgi:hypothetical protein
MADYSAAAAAIAPAEAGGRALLADALPASLRKLSLRRRFAALESADDPAGIVRPRHEYHLLSARFPDPAMPR